MKRKLVLPGDELGDGRPGNGAYKEDGKIYAKAVGVKEEKDDLIFVIPLSGVYDPKGGDGVIGRVSGITFSKWIIDINAPYEAVLPLSEATEEFVDLTKTDLTQYFSFGDLVFGKITNVTKSKSVQLSMKDRRCRKLRGGRIINVTPAKVPRIIGRKGSMVEMIKDKTKTQIVVGQNGVVWVKGRNRALAVEAIMEIEKRSQENGLTDSIANMLDEALKNSDTEKEGDNDETDN